MSNDIISETQTVEKRPDRLVIEVAVRGPLGLDQAMKTRARGRALLTSGVLPTTIDTVEDIAMGDIKRLTRISSISKGTSDEIKFVGKEIPVLGKILETKVVTVVVNRD